jgi:hypothetical protein
MAARQIIVPGAMPSRDRNGRILPAKLRFYVRGTAFNTPAVIYTDDTLAVSHDFPILSDSAGRWPAMWAEETDVFDVAWSDQVSDRPLNQWTGLSPANDAVLASVELAEAAEAAAEGFADEAEEWALQAQAAASDVTGAPFQATSATPLDLTVGVKTLQIGQAGNLFNDGQYVVIARKYPNASTQMVARVEEYAGTTMTASIGAVAGTPGNYSDWEISLTTAGGVQSLAGATGILTAIQARTAIDVYSVAQSKKRALLYALIF